MEASPLSTLIRKLRKPLMFSLLFAIVFFLVLFPTGDLGDLVSSKVSEITQNQVFLQFSNFSIGIAPPGVKFTDVFVETAFTPGISAEEITLAPSLQGLIAQKPYGSISAQGLLNGSLDISIKKGQSSETGNERQRLVLEVNKINLSSLREIMKWALALEGQLSITADAQGDLALSEQPEMDINLDLEKLAVPPATMNTMMGPLTLPDIKLDIVHLKGRLSNGKFNIETGEIGKKQDDLNGRIKGHWNVNLLMMGGRPQPQFGSYDFEIDLVANKNFQAKASLFLSLLDQYKTPTSEGARYRFRVSASDMMSPPSITATR